MKRNSDIIDPEANSDSTAQPKNPIIDPNIGEYTDFEEIDDKNNPEK